MQSISVYRKTHLYGQEENRLVQPGDYFVIAELEGVKVGLLIIQQSANYQINNMFCDG